MRFGLERIRALVSALGMPQHRFASIHVVGTNGKSSVTEIAAALLEAHGMSAGAYVSPHEERWAERIRIRGAEVDPQAFAAAVERVAQAVEAVNRKLEPGDSVTQFEADTATAFVTLAAARVEGAVIEAGLGGRLDATNVLPSTVTALTSIGLEHTQWLGDTEVEIAAEKLAVLRDHTTLVLGPVRSEVEALARRTAAERGARLVTVRDLAPALELPNPAPYLRRDFAVALAAAEALLGALDTQRVRDVAAGLELHGRMEVLDADPPTVLDAAHNPAGARATADAVGEAFDFSRLIGVVGASADKNVRGLLEAFEPIFAEVVITQNTSHRAMDADELAAIAVEVFGDDRVQVEPRLPDALEAAITLAEEEGEFAGGGVLVTGSVITVGEARLLLGKG
jgi:dihydrofolate synthase / folylpolyglutamate synthase